MVARFSDQKALAFAYTDLLDMGVSASCLRVHFDEVADQTQPMKEHHRFLQEVRDWLTSPHPHEQIDPETGERPSSPLFKGSGGVLEIDTLGQDTAIVQVIVHHSGTLVD